MPRPNPVDQLYRTFRDEYGSKAKTTERGLPAYRRDAKSKESRFNSDSLTRLFTPEFSVPVEIPSRNIAMAYLVQEMYSICSILWRGIMQLSGDAAQDSLADNQPFVIVVNGESSSTEQKIIEILDKGLRRTGVAEDTDMRHRRTLKTGMSIGQPIFEYDGLNWEMTKVKLMPTWDMIKDPVTGTWKQVRRDSLNNEVIAEWPIPGFLATATLEEDHNYLYGIPIGAHVIIDYRMMLMALEDLAAASRSRSVIKYKHLLKGLAGQPVDEKVIQSYKQRNKYSVASVVTDFYLRDGVENIEEIEGDAKGVESLMKTSIFHQNKMRRAIGLMADPENLSTIGREEVDAEYSRNINQLRKVDWKFIKSVGDKLLLLKGYKDVDWCALIPSLGETESNRTTRASKELELGHTGDRTYAATTGHKSVETLRKDVESFLEWRKQMYEKYGMPMPGEHSAQTMRDRQDVVGTENKKKGADPEKGRNRRKNQKEAGRTPTGA